MSPTPNRFNVTEEKIEKIDFSSLLHRIMSHWWMFVISILFCIGIAFVYLHYSTPMYKINAKLLVKDEKKGGGVNAGELLGDISGLLNMKSNVDNEVEILKTRILMERVVRALHLNIVYIKNGKVKDQILDAAPFTVELEKGRDTIQGNFFELTIPEEGNSYEIQYTDKISKEKVSQQPEFGDTLFVYGIGNICVYRNPEVKQYGTQYSLLISSVDARVAALRGALNVSVTNKLVTTIDLQLSYPHPEKGEEILSRLIAEYLQQNINDKNMIADSTIMFIENRLRLVSGELGGIEDNIQQFKQGNKLTDLSEQSKMLVSNASDLFKRVADIETQINIAYALEEYLKDEDKNKRVVPTSVLPEDVVFSKLVENYNMLLLERDRQMLTSTEDNPYIQNMDERIASLRASMLANLSGTRRSLEITRKELGKELAKLDGNIRKVPFHERTYLDLARQQQIKQELYLFLLQKREETAISKTANISNAKIIDTPKSDFNPFSPNRKFILLIGLMAGLAFPFAKIYMDGLFNNRVNSKEQITRLTSIPILGEICHNDKQERLIMLSHPRSVIAEQFRAMRTNLQFFLNNQKGNTIMVTSSMSGEGKSFTAANLGMALAMSGKKVVLLELDLRRPNLSPVVNLKNDSGFTNYVIQPAISIADILTQTSVHENLYVVQAGHLPPNPAELITHERVDQLIQTLQAQFEYIILDTPPIGLVTDAQLLNKYAHLTIYLVRQKYTYRDQLVIANDLYLTNKIKNMAIVINDIPKINGYGGYGYGYGYGMEMESSKFSKFKKMFRAPFKRRYA